MVNSCEDIALRREDPEPAIEKMSDEIAKILGENLTAIYLYGSYTLGDFRLGWSDLDILVLTKAAVSEEQAGRLVGLRQELQLNEPDCPFYRCFEGGMLSLCAFIGGLPDRAVYWGTSGQRITDGYGFDAFCRKELIENGRLLRGEEIRSRLSAPSCKELAENVRLHYESIRKYSHLSGESIYSFGWILDIARCVYTLRTGGVISKTAAGEWALKNRIFDGDGALKTALEVRKAPQKFFESAELRKEAAELGPTVQRYADVLEKELKYFCEKRTEG